MPGLVGKRVVVTRSPAQQKEFIDLLVSEGAIPVPIRLTETMPPKTWSVVDQSLADLATYDVVVLTSRNAVEHFVERVQRLGKMDMLRSRPLAAIGAKTKGELEKRGLLVKFSPSRAHAAEELAQTLASAMPLSGRKILFPRALEGREVLVRALEDQGARVDMVPVYQTVPSLEGAKQVRNLIQEKDAVDWLTFASSSSVRYFGEALGSGGFARWVEERTVHVAVIGRVTADTLQDWGLHATVVADPPTGENLVAAMVTYERNKKNG